VRLPAVLDLPRSPFSALDASKEEKQPSPPSGVARPPAQLGDPVPSAVRAAPAEEKQSVISDREDENDLVRRRIVLDDAECSIEDVLILSGHNVLLVRQPTMKHDDSQMFGAPYWAIASGSSWLTTSAQQAKMKSVLTSAAIDRIQVTDNRCVVKSGGIDLPSHWKLKDIAWLVTGTRGTVASGAQWPALWLCTN